MVAERSDELSRLRLCQLRFAEPRLSSMRESQTYRPAVLKSFAGPLLLFPSIPVRNRTLMCCFMFSIYYFVISNQSNVSPEVVGVFFMNRIDHFSFFLFFFNISTAKQPPDWKITWLHL